MSPALPSQPNLNQLKNQAKDLLKGHRGGESSVCAVLRRLNKFRDCSDAEILADELALNDAQFALALDYGFSSWNALKLHVQTASGQPPIGRVKRSGERVWIDGVRPLSWAKSGTCTFAGALASAFGATRQPYSYAELMGYTGLAFRLRWFRGMEVPEWCPSSPLGEFPQEIGTVSSVTGWHFEDVNQMLAPKPTMQEHIPQVIASIDHGVPVLGYPKELDVSVLYGYERKGERVDFLWESYNWDEPRAVPAEETGPFLLFPFRAAEVQDRREAFWAALTSKNWRRARSAVPSTPENKTRHYLFGDRAYEQWIDDVSRAEEFTGQQRESLWFVSAWCFGHLADARRQVAPFINQHAKMLDDPVASLLQRAAQQYGEMAARLTEVQRAHELFRGPWNGKTANDWSADTRTREIELLTRARQDEKESVELLDQALAERDKAVE